MILNKINQDQLEQISLLELNIFQENGYSLKELKSFNENNNFYFCLSLNQNTIIGYAIVFVSIDNIDIYKIAVNKNNQKQKIGSNLIFEIRQYFKNKPILIEVSNKDNTIDFYLKNQFKVITIRKKYYSDNSDAFLMELK